MTEGAKAETLVLIEQIRNRNVWNIKCIEYKDANVCSNIFDLAVFSIAQTRKSKENDTI
jgi:hypothetical protein